MELTSHEQKFLGKFDSAIEAILHQRPESAVEDKLREIGRYLCVGGSSKRVRPLLIWHFGSMAGLQQNQILDLALSTELMHSASLLHDDVVDKATRRRGRLSANLHFSNSLSVLGGNFLLTRAFRCLKTYESSVIIGAIDVISDMTEGAVLEISIQRKLDTSLDTWAKMAAGKTGALFAWCGKSVELLSPVSDVQGRFSNCGRQIGMAFQLADDVKDLTGDKGLKDSFSDLKNGEPSYPILLAASKSSAFRAACTQFWELTEPSHQELRNVSDLLRRAHVEQPCLNAIESSAKGAIDSLGAYAKHPSGRRIVEIASLLGDVSLKDAATSV